jgi:hypothetical protein
MGALVGLRAANEEKGERESGRAKVERAKPDSEKRNYVCTMTPVNLSPVQSIVFFLLFLMLYWCFAFFNESGVTRACRAQRFVAACERHPCPGMHVALLMLPFIGNTTRGLSFFQFK